MPQTDKPQSDSPTVEPTVEPIPPRFWWLKRIGVGVGLLVIALVALRLWWGWEANRRLQAEIDRIIAAGEPIYPEDFDPKEEIPDDQNAAKLLVKAEEAVSLNSKQQERFEEVLTKPASTAEHLDEVKIIIDDNRELFRLLRRARNLPKVDWGTRIRTPAINTAIPSFGGQRNLCKLMYVAVHYQHAIGADSEAVETLRDALAQSERLSQQGTLIAQLVRWACEALTIRAIEDVLPSLSIIPDPMDAGEATGAASRTRINSLMTDLLDDRGVREGMRRAMMCERMFDVDILKQLIQGTTSMSTMFGWRGGTQLSLNDAAWRHGLGPAMTLDMVGVLKSTSELVRAAGAHTFPDASGASRVQTQETGLGGFLHPLRGDLLGSIDRSFEIYFMTLAKRRLAATAVAIRLYEVDHGRRPETFAELVPDYLEKVPEDVFADGGVSLRYLPHAAHPVVYSLGVNGVDERGATKFVRNSPSGWSWQPDIAFFLDGWRGDEKESDDQMPVPPSSQAGEDEKKAEEDEGDANEEGEGEEKP